MRNTLWALLCACITVTSATSTGPTPGDASLLWGPYRPNLYLGFRPRIPKSLLLGFMWYNDDGDILSAKTLRHTCEQHDGMAGYGWTMFDARMGGIQVINDTGNNLDLIATFSKSQADVDHQHWILQVEGLSRTTPFANPNVGVVFYIGMEDAASSVSCGKKNVLGSATAMGSDVVCNGTVSSKFAFNFNVGTNMESGSLDVTVANTSVYGVQVDYDAIWKAKDIFLEQVCHSKGYGEQLPDTSNLYFVDMKFAADFKLEVSFHSSTQIPSHHLEPGTFTLKDLEKPFEDRFAEVYQPKFPFLGSRYRIFSKALLSNLMGGIGYFEGTSKVSANVQIEKTSLDDADTLVSERGPYYLFSAVPSRPFFPRGFLWDEGFHLQLIIDWDMDLAVEILLSWLDLMDENGWIAREQILGPEARSKVPSEFQTQYQHYANPPTMFRVVDMLIDRLIGTVRYLGVQSRYSKPATESTRSRLSNQARELLDSLEDRLSRHYSWFIRTQAGDLSAYDTLKKSDTVMQGYRWRGRTSQHILTSGLDDYPRAPRPSTNELHVDALCWVGAMVKTLGKLSSVLHPDADAASEYSNNMTSILTALEAIHWSEAEQAYCDTTILDPNSPNVSHICHKGYISLLPFLTGLLSPAHPHLPSILSLIESPDHLWSPYGLRSVSISSPFYGTGENYWRGPVWVNFNYMALESLLDLAQQSGPLANQARSIYSRLRQNIVNTVYQSWRDTGFAWEQYNPETGKGQRTQHFTGWTALIVRIMAMPDLTGETDTTLISVVQAPVEAWSSRNYFWILLALSLILCILFRRRLLRVCRGWS